MPKRQGREFKTTLQANTKKELNSLIKDTRVMAKRQGMEDFKVLRKGKDADMGYEAIVVAHNVNIKEWIKSKIGSKETKTAARAEIVRSGREEEELGRAKEKIEEEKRRKKEEERIAGEERRISELQRKQKLAEASKGRAVAGREAAVAIGAARKAEHEARHPTIAAIEKGIRAAPGRMVTGAGRIAKVTAPVIGGAVAGFREVMKVRGATAIKRKWGKKGELLEEEIEREPRRGLFYPTRTGVGTGLGAGLYGDLSQLRSLTAPGALTGGMGLGHLRQLMQPGAISKEPLPTVKDLTKTQQEVYNAIQGGANTVEAIVTATDKKKSTVVRTISTLQEKGLIQRG